MQVSAEGLDFIRHWEGCSLEAYQDSAGVWTIGVGHTADVQPGDTITMEEAEDLLKEDVEWAEQAVNDLIRVPLGQRQFDALVSFAFNTGRSAVEESTLRERLNDGVYLRAPQELCRWIFAAGEMSLGLARRRVAEAERFLRDRPPEQAAE